MLDIKIIRENPKHVKDNLKLRGNPVFLENFDKLVNKDKKWRELKGEADNLRAERNKVSIEILEAKKANKPVDKLLKRAREIPEKLKEIEEEEKILEEESQELLRNLPNIIDKSVPVGDASKNIR